MGRREIYWANLTPINEHGKSRYSVLLAYLDCHCEEKTSVRLCEQITRRTRVFQEIVIQEILTLEQFEFSLSSKLQC